MFSPELFGLTAQQWVTFTITEGQNIVQIISISTYIFSCNSSLIFLVFKHVNIFKIRYMWDMYK